MNSITVTLPDDRWEQLRQAAARLGMAPEDLVRAGIEELLARPADEFRESIEYVLKKNADLYRRLA